MKLRLHDPLVRALYRTHPELSLSRLAEKELRRDLGLPPPERDDSHPVTIKLSEEVRRALVGRHPPAAQPQIFKNYIVAALRAAAKKGP